MGIAFLSPLFFCEQKRRYDCKSESKCLFKIYSFSINNNLVDSRNCRLNDDHKNKVSTYSIFISESESFCKDSEPESSCNCAEYSHGQIWVMDIFKSRNSKKRNDQKSSSGENKRLY